MGRPSLDRVVIHVTDGARSNASYGQVPGAEVIARAAGFAYCFGGQQLSAHGPGAKAAPLARHPVPPPGGSDLCLARDGTLAEAEAHLSARGIAVELGPVARNGARGPGESPCFRDPDGSLVELIVSP